MAVDTAEKRYSMLNFWDGTTIHLLPETDGSIDSDDQQHLLDCYSGIPFAAPPAPAPDVDQEPGPTPTRKRVITPEVEGRIRSFPAPRKRRKKKGAKEPQEITPVLLKLDQLGVFQPEALKKPEPTIAELLVGLEVRLLADQELSNKMLSKQIEALREELKARHDAIVTMIVQKNRPISKELLLLLLFLN